MAKLPTLTITDGKKKFIEKFELTAGNEKYITFSNEDQSKEITLWRSDIRAFIEELDEGFKR